MKKHLKSYILNLTSNKGYTIIELLAVAGILVVLSSIIVGIIYSTLRGSRKTQLITQVSQNGRYSVTVLEGIISDSRNITKMGATDIDDCTSNPSSIGSSSSPTSSITLARLDGGTTTLACSSLPNAYGFPVYTIASNGVSLLDTTNVKSSFCTFSCSQIAQDPYSIPIVNVSYKIVGLFQSYSSPGFTAAVSTSLRVYSP